MIKFLSAIIGSVLFVLALDAEAYSPIIPVEQGGYGATIPEWYGAKGDTKTVFDGAYTASNTSTVTNGTSTAPATPTMTTTVSNTKLVSIFATSAAWSVTPSVGTTRATVTYAASNYGFFVSDQTVVGTGATTPVSGTLGSSAAWETASIALAPISGQTVTFIDKTTSNSASANTITLNVPAGVSQGNFLVACTIMFSSFKDSYDPTGKWTKLVALANNNRLNCWGKVASANEPASYQFKNYNGTNTALAGAMLAYSGTYGPDSSSNVLTSATASFTAADIGKLVCIATFSPRAKNPESNYYQTCGKIIDYLSATQVYTNQFAVANLTALQFAYGTDDTAAFTTMLTTAPCTTTGCAIHLGSKAYALTGSLAIPVNRAVKIEGTTGGIPNTPNTFINSNAIVNANTGTKLQWMTTDLNATAFSIKGSVGVTSTAAFAVLRDLSLAGGVGKNLDGVGGNGVDILNWQGALLQNVIIYNFSGIGVYIDGMAASSYKDYIENINLTSAYIVYNGGTGMQVGSALGVNNIESVSCDACIIEGNGAPGVTLAGTNIQGFNLTRSTLQWNNQLAAGVEFYTTGAVSGGRVEGNYFEAGNTAGSLDSTVFNSSVGMLGLYIGNNHYDPTSRYSPMLFSAAGTALPACDSTSFKIAYKHATVSDATVCTNGTTYTSGGSTHCDVTCLSNLWVESGSATW